MLDIMRRKAQSWMIKVLLGLIVVVFAFWGVGSIRERQFEVIAEVGDATISYRVFQQNYEDTLQAYQQQFGPALTDEMLKALNLKQRVMDDLIEKALLLQEADRLGIIISEEELEQAILQYPAFQNQGVFNQELYLRVLRANRMNPGDFEQDMAEQMKISRMQNIIRDAILISDQEIFEQYEYYNEKWNHNFVKFPISPEKVYASGGKKASQEPLITEEELKKYYDDHPDAFKTPLRRRVLYLHVKDKDFLDRVQVSDREVEDYYEINVDQYKIPEKVHARHILIKIVPSDTPTQVAEKRKKIEKILEEAKSGTDFAELARKYSQDGTASDGGDLGYFARGEMVGPFEKAAFELKPGEISPVVKTRFGFHIIKLEDRQEARTKPLEEVREQAEQAVIKQKAQELAYEEAEKLDQEVYERNSLEKVAEERGIRLETTEPFSREEDVPGLGYRPEFVKAAFEYNIGEISKLISEPSDHFILKVLEEIPPYVPEFEEVKEQVKLRLRETKAKEKARKEAEEFLAALRKQDASMDDLAAQFGVEKGETGLFPRQNEPTIPKIGRSEELWKEAVSLDDNHRLPEKVHLVDDAYVVISFKE
ncbi:MAG: SurA N-terminal domain-containing protein, partial [Deltaproteobacteria bacterium]|nr:SurA N-terminal domain-containing protein [Deltaproteobacteria bacterium]